MTAFDANVRLGRLSGSRGRYFESAGDIVSAMDAMGIRRSLVYSSLARQSDYVRGNRLLHEKIDGDPRLEPCWTGVPNREDPEEFTKEMNRCSVRALRLFPTSSHFSVHPWCIGSLAEALARNGKVLLLDFEGQTWADDRIDWGGIKALCDAYPELKVVICGATMASPANYDGFLEGCGNLHLEISQLISPGEIQRLVQKGLGRRLIFGSDMPTRHPGAPLCMVTLSGLGESHRKAILHENLERLLGASPATQEIGLREIPTLPDVVDTHVHLGGWNHSCAGSGRAEETVRDMDRCGIKTSIATSLWSCFGEVPLGNADVAAACQRFPGRFYGYLTLDPKHRDEVRGQIERYRKDAHFRGIKLHQDTHRVEIQEPYCAEILSYANEREMPVLVHGRIDSDPWQSICGLYPRAKFIVAHVGGGGPDSEGALRLAALAGTVENLYFDLAASRNFFGFLDELVELAGADKILYGSDHPLMDFGFEMGQVLLSNLSEVDKHKILAGNARRIFKL